ncbi:MAG: Holliday junction resolvase RuvX [Hormoscilla sp. GUM202]|nr:Holliday junction resolvase RuvX [Hormoscilla sp. GUM202]
MVIISALGLDIGKKRIGVAGCDGTGLIATGLTTISRTSRFFGPSAARTRCAHAAQSQVVASLRELVVERQVQVLVIGIYLRRKQLIMAFMGTPISLSYQRNSNSLDGKLW